MEFTFFKRIRLLAQANPTAWRLLGFWLSLIWISFVLSVTISRLVVSLPLSSIFYTAILLSALGCLGYLFIFSQASTYIYYRMFVPFYGLTKSAKPNALFRILLFFSRCDDRWLDLIWQSQLWNRQNYLDKEGIHKGDIFKPDKSKSALPVVIRREHIRSRLWTPDCAFTITLLFNQINLQRHDDESTLNIDLRNQSCAIYSPRGKQFILSKFLPADPSKYLSLSKDIHDFLVGRSQVSEMSFQINALRWASGGFLPIAKWHGRQWVCLFYRDIYPVGWNIANGASETKEEYIYLNRTIYREMIEELAVIRGSPCRYAELEHRFLMPPGLELIENITSPPELVKEHNRLRKEHDKVLLELKRGADLNAISTRHSVRVSFHDDWKDATPVITKNILIAINPLELGIEVVKVGKFDLHNDEVLLDGEVYTSSKAEYLVRRPVVMISTDFLKRCYRDRGNSLGQKPTGDHDDRKTLERVPKGEYHLFTEELTLRRARLKDLEKAGLSNSSEASRLKDWARNVEVLFKDAANGGELKGDLSTLLPVTWKTIEMAIELNIL